MLLNCINLEQRWKQAGGLCCSEQPPIYSIPVVNQKCSVIDIRNLQTFTFYSKSFNFFIDGTISVLNDNIVCSCIARWSRISLKGKFFSVCVVNLSNFIHSQQQLCVSSQDIHTILVATKVPTERSKLVNVSLFRRGGYL